MNYSFEYIDIILLAMIAGFIFLRLRGILGKRSGFDGKAPTQFDKILKEAVVNQKPKMSVANPVIIRSNAAKAIAAPDIISKVGTLFLPS